jgi:hypothetical protein
MTSFYDFTYAVSRNSISKLIEYAEAGNLEEVLRAKMVL